MVDVATRPATKAVARRVSRVEMRMLAGMRKGARTALGIGKTVTLGYDAGHDIVVRDVALKNLSLMLHPGPDTFHIEVLQGEVRVIGRLLKKSESLQVPNFVPIVIDGTSCSAFSIGPGSQSSWAWSESLASEAINSSHSEKSLPESVQRLSLENPAAIKDKLADLVRNVKASKESSSRTFGLPSVVIGLAMVALSVVVIAFGLLFLLTPPEPVVRTQAFSPTDSLNNLDQAIRQSGIRGAKISRENDGTASLLGFVNTDAEVASLSRLVSANATTVRIAVQSGERLERNILDVLNAKGLQAKIVNRDKQNVSVQISNATSERQAEILRTLASDVPNLGTVSLSLQGTTAQTPDKKHLVELEKQIISVVSGDPSYVVTTDGGRHYLNAFLPGGHRILSITANEVNLERNGSKMTLRF